MSIHFKLLVATFVWGLTPTLGKILSTLEAPFIITFGRFFFACVWLFAILLLRRKGQLVGREFLGTFLLLGLTGIFLHNVLMYEGLEYISASMASLIFAFIVVQVAIIDSIINKKIPHKKSIVGMFFSVIGILIVVTDGQIVALPREELGWGAVLIFGSAFSWAVYTVVSRKALKTYSPLTVTTYASGVGLILVAPFPLASIEESIHIFTDAQSLLFLIFLGVVSSAITFIWHQQALEKIGALSTSIYLNLVPIFGILSAAIILGENLNEFIIVGGILVLLGIILVNTVSSVDR
tara:strand:+ start:1461 stop:2342 length:882 start_codon:yes stop_codon:yes gene_type:complete